MLVAKITLRQPWGVVGREGVKVWGCKGVMVWGVRVRVWGVRVWGVRWGCVDLGSLVKGQLLLFSGQSCKERADTQLPQAWREQLAALKKEGSHGLNLLSASEKHKNISLLPLLLPLLLVQLKHGCHGSMKVVSLRGHCAKNLQGRFRGIYIDTNLQ